MIRAKNLMKKFKTIKALKEADVTSLKQTEGMSKVSAEKVYEYFHSS
jgi:excinuclease UvrABC nuclease subunit